MIETLRLLGQPALRLTAADGAQATVLLYGAQVVSWRPAGDQERLYLSPQALAGDGQPVRGGIPVVFPQFSMLGPLPQHGFARTALWQHTEHAERDGVAIAVLRLEPSAASAAWPHAFECELTVAVGGLTLDVELAVGNTGDAPFSFTAALHSYLRVDDVRRARLDGLYGALCRDRVSGAEYRQEIDPIQFVGEIDRIYLDVEQPLSLSSAAGRLALAQEGFADVVVWNPGEAKARAIADLPDDGWLEFVCVEAAAIARPVTLAAGESWAGRQSLAV